MLGRGVVVPVGAVSRHNLGRFNTSNDFQKKKSFYFKRIAAAWLCVKKTMSRIAADICKPIYSLDIDPYRN